MTELAARTMPRTRQVSVLRFVLLAAMLAALAAVPKLLPTYHVSVATEILIFAALAMSIDVLAGFAGRTSLCHGAIFGTATYVVIYATGTAGLSLPVALLLGVAAAVALALVFALLAVRTSGVYFLLLTLALGLVVWGVCLRWTQSPEVRTAFAGSSALAGSPIPTTSIGSS